MPPTKRDMNEADPYGPLRRALVIADPVQALTNGPQRRSVARLLGQLNTKSVLDVGCGSGGLSRLLADRGFQVTGIDSSPTMLARARSRSQGAPRFRVVASPADALPFADGRFDAAVISLVLHEVDAPMRDRIWAEMRRVVRRTGVLVAADFTRPGSNSLLTRIAGRIIEADEKSIGSVHPPHYRNFLEFMRHGGLEAWLGERSSDVIADSRHLWGNVGVFAVPAT